MAAAAVLRWLAEPPLSSRLWRIALGRVGEAIDFAKRARGRERRYAWIRACQLMVDVQAPGWRTRGPNGTGYKVSFPGVREIDRCEARLERRLAKLVDDCIGCLAGRPLPEDPPRRRRACAPFATSRRSRMPTGRIGRRRARAVKHRRS